MNIIYEDSDKILINKPAGQLTQSSKSFDLDLVSEVMTYRRQKGEPAYAAVINRLDRPVSGVVLLAKNKAAAARYSNIMQQEGFNKEYLALVHGTFDEKTDSMTDYLLKTKDNTAIILDRADLSSISADNHADAKLPADTKLAKLTYEVVSTFSPTCNPASSNSPDTQSTASSNSQELNPSPLLDEKPTDLTISLVRIHLITGRFHQIRAQFAHRGHAVLNDKKYGTVSDNCPDIPSSMLATLHITPREIALCAHSLTVDGTIYTVTPPWATI